MNLNYMFFHTIKNIISDKSDMNSNYDLNDEELLIDSEKFFPCVDESTNDCACRSEQDYQTMFYINLSEK